MKILHSSDWHLGRMLYGQKRYAEFEAFLNWLVGEIQQQQVEVLLIAGDVFDNATPSNRAQELYYRFLCQVAQAGCAHVVIVAGNHDSPTFLDAPRALLKNLNIHVVGGALSEPADEVLLLNNPAGEPALIVCAVPYLRDRDLRTISSGETMEDKDLKLVLGIQQHYATVAAYAESLRQAVGREIPIVAMGHLFAAGGKTVSGDGVRELYVGSLAHVSGDIFPANFDYVALGHLHVPQQVTGPCLIRYSGSPIAMGFGEAGQQKSVCLLEFEGRQIQHSLLPVPVFQPLKRLQGDLAALTLQLQTLAQQGEAYWLEVIYDSDELCADLRAQLMALIENTPLSILRIQNRRLFNPLALPAADRPSLEEWDVYRVFDLCLEHHQITPHQRLALQTAYAEVLLQLQQQDVGAE